MDPYEWDEAKYAENVLKHGFGFELVGEFDWDSAVFEIDDRYDYGEERVRAFGRVGTRPFCVVYTMRGDQVRIISFRAMHEKEAKRYGI